MSGYRKYKHVFPSWEVYPRVHYFQKLFNDLLVRFNRVTGALPESFREKGVETALEQIRSEFERGLQVTVIGKEDIDEKNLVIATAVETKPQTYDSPELQKHDGAKLNVVVCHIDLESLGEQAIKDTTEVIDLAQTVSQSSSIILTCDTNCLYQDAEISEFKKVITESRQYCLQQQNILVGSEASSLQKRISDTLEDVITDGFSKISTSLQRFESDDDKSHEFSGEIIHSDEVVNAIRDFLRNLQTIKDLKDATNGTQVLNDTFAYRVLHHLCHVIKCAAVPPLARKYSQQLWVCNRLLQEIELEEALVHSVTKNTLYHLSKIEKDLKTLPPNQNKSRRFLFILYPLQQDMKSTFENTEKKFSGMERLSLITRKMLFETNGYIKQTNLGLLDVDGKTAIPAKISDELRGDLLSIKGVYGLGTIYGKLEIHLDLSLIADEEIKNDMKPEKEVDEEMDLQDFTSNNESNKPSDYGKLKDHRDQNLIADGAEKNFIQSDKDDNLKQTKTDMPNFSSNNENTKTSVNYQDLGTKTILHIFNSNSNSQHTKTSGYDYGIGTICGEIKSHHDHTINADEVEKNSMQSDNDDNSKQTKTDLSNGKYNKAIGYDYDMNRSNTDKEKARPTLKLIKDEIIDHLKKHRFHQPYTVKYVEKKAEVMNGSFEPGEKLLSPTDTEGQYTYGTIGGYAVSTQKKLYGLTCFHVIGLDGKVYTDNGKQLFGTYQKGMENTTYPFIDIAAVEVTSTLQDEYKNYLERAMTRVTKVKLSFENKNELIGRYVYKFGAATGVTKGTIMAVDYSLFNSKARSYLIVIDPLAADKTLDDFSKVFTPLRRDLPSTANDTVVQSSNLTNQSAEQHKYQTDSQQPNYKNKVVTQSPRTSAQAFAQSPIIASQELAQLQTIAKPTLPSNTESQPGDKSSNKQNETVQKLSNQPVVRSSDTEHQCLVRPSDTERQFVVRASDTGHQIDEGSSDTESQSVIRAADSVTQCSDTENHSAVRSSDTELRYVARSLYTERQFAARSSDDERSSDTESMSVVRASDKERNSVARFSDDKRHSVARSVRKWPSVVTHKMRPRFKGTRQTITQTSTSLNVKTTIQIKSKVVSQSQNNECQILTEQIDGTRQRVAKSFNDASQTYIRSLNSPGQTVTDLLKGTIGYPGHELIAEHVSQHENAKDSNDKTESEACPNKGQNELQLESKLENIKLNGRTGANVVETTIAKQTKNVDSLVSNYEMQENDAVGKVNETQTYGKKQRSRSPVQKLVLTSGIEDPSAQAHTDVNSTTLVYVRDINGVTKSDESISRNLKGAFALNGDSGAIICTPDPSTNGLTCLAVSMLTGGSLEISGRPGLKSLSFTLREGLDKISKHCDLKFL